MRRGVSRFLFAVAVLTVVLTAGLSHAAGPGGSSNALVRTAVYVGSGALSNGVFNHLQINAFAEGLSIAPVDESMIAAGVLDQFDLLVIPGGSSTQMANALGEKGRKNICDFVRNGGSYFGTCAGSCLVMQDSASHTNMLGIIPFRSVGNFGSSEVQVLFDARGAATSGVRPGVWPCSYALGPMFVPGDPVEGAEFESVATFGEYLGELSAEKRAQMRGKTCAVAGTYGKGRVFVTTFHPEVKPATHPIVRGAYRFLLGRDVTWKIPDAKDGRLNVGYLSDNGFGVASALFALRLIKDETVNVIPVSRRSIDRGCLKGLDVLLAVEGSNKRPDPYLKKHVGPIKDYLARGGRFIATGKPAHAFSEALGDAVVEVEDIPAAEKTITRVRAVLSSAPHLAVEAGSLDLTGVFPPEVKCVYLVAPCSFPKAANVIAVTNALDRAGFRVKVSPSVWTKAKDAAEKARDFEMAWKDPSADLILCACGGKGCEATVTNLNFDVLRSRDLPVVGFSNASCLLNAFVAKGVSHLISGPMGSTMASYPHTRDSLERLATTISGAPLPPTQLTALRPAKETLKGKAIGGHWGSLSRLSSDFLPSTDGRIVFIEIDVYSLANAKQRFLELKGKGYFKSPAAVVICELGIPGAPASHEEMKRFITEALDCPVYAGYPYGHVPKCYALDFARTAQITPDGELRWKPFQ